MHGPPPPAARTAMAVGLVLAVTAFAFDNLAITTAMPAITDDLGGVALYGAAFSALALTMLFSLAVSGPLADRYGPRPVLAAGLATFTGGLVLGGAAPTMFVVVVARAVQGLGAGAIGTCAYVVIGRAWATDERARMFAVLSAAWIIPGLVAPGIAGLVAEHLGWRYVFFGLVPFPVVAAALALPALRAVGPVEPAAGPHGEVELEPTGERSTRRLDPLWTRARHALALAGGAGVLLAGIQQRRPLLAVALVAGGSVLAVPALRALVPAGTFRALPILPALVAYRAMLNWAFFGADAFIPYGLHEVRGYGPGFTGGVLTIASMSWSGAAWLQARPNRATTRQALLAGLAMIAAGTVLVALVTASTAVPVWFVFVGWALGGAGMGIAFNATSVAALEVAESGEEGTTGSALQLADALGTALATGLGGTLVAIGHRSGWRPSATVVGVFAITIAAVVPAAIAARRLPRSIGVSATPAPA